MKERLVIIDFFKGFSITMIVIMHLLQTFIAKEINIPKFLMTASSFGGAGVHLFLVCSGFGLYLSYSRRPISFLTFLNKRFKKIYIPYAIIILISALFPLMYLHQDKMNAILSHLLLYKMFSPNLIGSFGVQFWFISTIIQMYLIFYPLIFVKNKFKSTNLFFICSLIISICFWILLIFIGKSDDRVWTSFFLNYLWEFVLGIIIAEQFSKKKTIFLLNMKIYKIVGIFLVSFLIYSFLSLKGGALKTFNDPFSMISFLFLTTIIFRLGISVINKTFNNISTFSYELYLVHILVLTLIFNYVNVNFFMKSLFSLLICFAIAKFYNVILVNTIYKMI